MQNFFRNKKIVGWEKLSSWEELLNVKTNVVCSGFAFGFGLKRGKSTWGAFSFFLGYSTEFIQGEGNMYSTKE